MTQENKTQELAKENTDILMTDIKEMLQAHNIKLESEFLERLQRRVQMGISQAVNDGFSNGGEVAMAICWKWGNEVTP